MSITGPARSFPLFAHLPKELRLQIWSAALEPRVIPLHKINDRVKGRGILFPMRITTVGFIALTTKHPSLDALRRVCPEVQLLCRSLYREFEVWDVRKNCSGTPYDPMRDVVFFSDPINPSIMLAFASQHPLESSSLRTIALPSIRSSELVSREEVLAALHIFENLKEVIIIAGNGRVQNAGLSWLGGSDGINDWTLPGSVEDALEELKENKWPEWRIPVVTIVKSQEDILGRASSRERFNLSLDKLP